MTNRKPSDHPPVKETATRLNRLGGQPGWVRVTERMPRLETPIKKRPDNLIKVSGADFVIMGYLEVFHFVSPVLPVFLLESGRPGTVARLSGNGPLFVLLVKV
jgi:hypothetical protein